MSQSQSLLELLEALAKAFRKYGTRWYLFGAQAVVVWGEPRMTADVDVTVELESEQAPALVAELETAGFKLRIHDVADLVLRNSFWSALEGSSLGALRFPSSLPRISLSVLAGRAKDLEDVRGILGERHLTLDLEQIRGTIGLLEEALGQSDLQPVFEAELRRAIGS